jgi:hypothetical protein
MIFGNFVLQIRILDSDLDLLLRMSCAGILEQSVGARKRVGIGFVVLARRVK